jgi:hypothetical protein
MLAFATGSALRPGALRPEVREAGRLPALAMPGAGSSAGVATACIGMTMAWE